MKSKEFDAVRHAYEERINALESQKKVLMDKTDLNEVHTHKSAYSATHLAVATQTMSCTTYLIR